MKKLRRTLWFIVYAFLGTVMRLNISFKEV